MQVTGDDFLLMHWLLILVNKRLDEWVTGERLDYTKIQLPKKDNKSSNKRGTDSRSSSPDKEIIVVSLPLSLKNVKLCNLLVRDASRKI